MWVPAAISRLLGRASEAHRSPSPPPLCVREESAYALLESARLRCEQLGARELPEGSWLRALHRELGLAGYLVSARIPSDRRGEVLAGARSRVRQAPRRAIEAELRELRELLRHAEEALERALVAPELSDHVARAQEPLARACELLSPRGQAGASSGATLRGS
jgi:hypothetical protein